MQARMKNPALVMPEVMPAVLALNAALEKGTVPKATLGLVHMRISQINGCAVCLDLHAHGKHYASEKPERMLTVAAWRDAPFFTPPERAALALAESITTIAGRGDVPDDVWAEASKHYDEAALAHLVMHVALVNLFNRINVTTRQVAGAQRW